MCRNASASGTAIRTKVDFLKGFRACRRRQGCQLDGAATSVRRRFFGSSRASHCLPSSMNEGCLDQSTMARREIDLRSGITSTYAGLMSPPGGESPMGLRSVRFDSGLHGRVRVVCLFCAREPPCSHLAPCGLFVSAPGARHASALGGMAPKFFRWIHCLPRRRSPRPKRQVQR
jgi:hypothetical protein